MNDSTDWNVGSKEKLTFDPLLNCLVFLTKHFDRPCSTHTLTAGLPLEDNKLNPELFVRAASRARLAARLLPFESEKFDNKHLPATILLNDQNAWVLTNIDNNGDYQVIQPESGEGLQTVSRDEFDKHYMGYAIFTKPKYRFNDNVKEKKSAPTKGWFWRVIQRSLGIYSEVLIASFLINCFALASPLFILNVYDRVVPNAAINTLWVLAVGVTIIFIFDFIMKNLRSYFITAAGKQIDVRLSREVFERILDLEMGSRPKSVGSLVNTVHAFEAFRDFITSATITTVIDVPFTIIFLTVIAMLAGNLVLIPIIMIPIILSGSFFIQRPLNRNVSDMYNHNMEKQAVLIESLSCPETIKSIRAQGPLQRRWESVIKNIAHIQTKSQVLTNFGIYFSIFAQVMGTISVVIFSVYKIANGEMTSGALIACVILTGRVLAPMTQVAGLLIKYQEARSGLESVEALMHLPVERPAETHFLERLDIKGSIRFDSVSFQYPEQKLAAIQNVSFTIKPGEKIGIIGRTGSGKTTIEKLILKLYQPNNGSILIDGTEISQIDPAELRYHIGYVPQDVTLFNTTIKQNITAGAPFADDEAILSAAKISTVSDFVDRDPEGFDRQVGERGECLSGGQRQAIALARALILDPPILLFDEPTNSMDDTTTAVFLQRFKSTLPNKTLILVTHKASLLKLVDRLIVMDNGRLIASGPREEVIEQIKAGKLKVKNNAK